MGSNLSSHKNGERRRTSGGVYLLLLKRDNTITSNAMKEIFADDVLHYKRKRKKLKKRNKKKIEQIKETIIREKLLNLNTDSFIQDSEMRQSDILLEVKSNNLEEVELTVTNPPPSPATDQDTPPSRTLGVYSEDEDNTNCVIQSDNLCRKIASYDDDDDDCLDVTVDDMDLF